MPQPTDQNYLDFLLGGKNLENFTKVSPEQVNTPVDDPYPLPPISADDLGMTDLQSVQPDSTPAPPPVAAPSGAPDLYRKEDMVNSVRRPPIDQGDPEMEDAKKKTRMLELIQGLGKGAAQIGAGLSRTKPDENYLNNIDPKSEINDLLTERKSSAQQLAQKIDQFNFAFAKDKDDPNSKSSQFYRQILGKYQPGLKTDGMSASELEKLMPQITNLANNEAARQAKLDLAREQMDAKEGIAKDKKEKDDTKRIDTAGKLITAELSSRSQFGKDAVTLAAAENVKALLNGTADLNSIDTRQMAEVARILDRILSGGNPSEHGFDSMSVSTLRSKTSRMLEQLSNKRVGAGAASFLQNQSDTVDREAKVARDRIARTQGKLLAPYMDLRDNDNMKSVLIQNHLPATLLSDLHDQVTGKTPVSNGPASYTPAQESGIKAVLDANPGATRQQAIDALKKAGKL
jgi:hypothetical protein